MKCRRHERHDCPIPDCRFDRIDDTLALILHHITHIERNEYIMSQELDALTSAVEEETTVDQSIITLLNGIAAQLEAAKNDPAKIAAVTAQIRQNSAAISAAVKANTPSDTGTSPEPGVDDSGNPLA